VLLGACSQIGPSMPARRAYLEASLRRLATELAPQKLDPGTRLQHRVLQDPLEYRYSGRGDPARAESFRRSAPSARR